MEILSLHGFSYSYPNTGRKALNDVTLTVNEGEFILVCGASGSGKSTLLENLKPELRRNGTRSGEVHYKGRTLAEMDKLESACDIGFVMQNVESQLVTDTVRAELCFGLESLGFPGAVIRRRVAEMASFFGMSRLLNSNVNSLSGGEKQMVNLASVLALSPKLLLLDEPTSQLDPVASRAFTDMLVRLNRELGITVMIAEHRTEDLFAVCDRVLLLDKGSVQFYGDHQSAAQWIGAQNSEVFSPLLPSAAQIFPEAVKIPLTVREGRELFGQKTAQKERPSPKKTSEPQTPPAISAKGVYFSYGGAENLILSDFDIELYENELTAIMGDNGAGKTTLLKVLCGLLKPQRGKVALFQRQVNRRGAKPDEVNAAYLPQNPRLLFIEDTVQADLLSAAAQRKVNNPQNRVQELAEALMIEGILGKHPYDVSAGELQRAAIAKILLAQPRLVLLDEPTKALDPYAKARLAEVLLRLKRQGVTIVMASHDAEFCARYCDRCALLFDGRIACISEPRQFFGGNIFYTTAANRIASGFSSEAITCEEVRKLCGE